MPKAAVAQTGFTTGEVSPLCYGVFDNPRYKKGLEIGLNYIPTLQGPLTRRPGTKYLTNVKDSANPPVFIPFQFSASQNYILEFGDQYIRFFANNGQLITVGTSYQLFGTLGNSANIQLPLSIFHATRTNTLPLPNEILTAPPSPITAGSILELQSPYAVGAVPNIRWAQNGDTLYLFHAQYRPFKLQRQSQTEWTIKPVFFTDGPYLPANSFALAGDNADVTLNSQDTNQITSVVVGNLASVTGAIADPGGSGQIQITTSAGNGVATGAKIFIQGVVGTTEANNYSSAAGRTSTNAAYWVVKVTSPTTFLLLGSVFTHAYVSGGAVAPALFATSAAQALLSPFIQDVGRSIALVIGGKRYWGYINTVYDAATIDVYTGGTTAFNPTAFPGGNAQASVWYLGTYSGQSGAAIATANGFPSCGAFHQSRLWMAGAPNYPQNVDSSNSGELFEVFSPSDLITLNVKDSNSCSFVLASDDQNALRWMASTAQGLLAASASAEWAMTPSGNSEALTPTNFNAQQTSFYGAAPIAPAKIGNAVMYVQRAQRKLREMAFFFSAGTFRSSDLTEISEHLTLPSLDQIVVQKETQPLIWGRRSDGVLTSLVYNRDDVSLSAGWMRHILGGNSDSSGNPAKVLSFAVIPDPTGAFDQMWLVVQRYINGATICAVEYMTKIPDDSIAQADSFHLDSGSTYSGSPATTISGLTWLIGETVGVLTDGGIHPDCVVDNSGAIHLNYSASKVQVGYRYKSQGKLLRAEAGAADGTSIGKTRRTTRVAFQLHRCGDISIGTEFANLIPLQFSQADQNQADMAVPLFSGMIREGVESAYDFESQVCFESSSPLPATIQSITSFMEEFDT